MADERRDRSVETAWNAMLALETRFSATVYWDLLTAEELRDMKSLYPQHYQLITTVCSPDSLMDSPFDTSIDQVRPFLGESLYELLLSTELWYSGRHSPYMISSAESQMSIGSRTPCSLLHWKGLPA